MFSFYYNNNRRYSTIGRPHNDINCFYKQTEQCIL